MTEKGAVEQGLCIIQVIETRNGNANDRGVILIPVCKLYECYQLKETFSAISTLLSLLSIGRIAVWLQARLVLHFHNPPDCSILLDYDLLRPGKVQIS